VNGFDWLSMLTGGDAVVVGERTFTHTVTPDPRSFAWQCAERATLYSFARMKVAPQVPLAYRSASYDLECDWWLVDVGLYQPVVVTGEELHTGRVIEGYPAFREGWRRRAWRHGRAL